jgi:hypothetical protein
MMALYWPEKKVALEIVDDPERRPFEAPDPEEWRVLHVSVEDLASYDRFTSVMRRLGGLLGTPPEDAKLPMCFDR